MSTGIGVGISPVFGGQVAGHPFEVSNATWWIDAGLEPQTASGASAQWVLNRGDARVGHARVGSSGRAELRGRFGLLLPGTAGNYASVPDSAALSITGDIDIKAKVTLTNWTPSNAPSIVSKWVDGSSGYEMTVQDSGKLQFRGTKTGPANFGSDSSVATGFANGSTNWIRTTVKIDNGAGGADIKFYTSADGNTWTQLGTTQTIAGTFNIIDGTVALAIGAYANATTINLVNGTVHRVIIQSAYDTADNTSNVVFDADFTTAPEFASSFTATTGQTVTINATSGADSNDPLLLAHMGTNYLYLPGTNGNYASVPDSNALDITGDLDIRARVAAPVWNAAATGHFIGKQVGTSDISYVFSHLITGPLRLLVTTNGSTSITIDSTAGLQTRFADGETGWVRVTLDIDDGAGNRVAKFYTAPDSSTMPTSWTQLGTNVTGAALASIHVSASTLCVGATNNGSFSPFLGSIYRTQLRDGIDGTVVFDADFTTGITSGGQTSFTASTGQTVTINRSTSGRKAVAVVRPVWLFGTDDYLEVADNDLLDFGASESFTVMAVVRQWHYNAIQVIARKRPASNPGWSTAQLTTAGSELEFVIEGPASTSATSNVAGGVVGSLQTATFVRNVASDTIASYRNGISGTPVTDTTTSSLANSGSLLIGRREVSPELYLNAELFAVAVWRRALTAAEITAITNYYGAA